MSTHWSPGALQSKLAEVGTASSVFCTTAKFSSDKSTSRWADSSRFGFFGVRDRVGSVDQAVD